MVEWIVLFGLLKEMMERMRLPVRYVRGGFATNVNYFFIFVGMLLTVQNARMKESYVLYIGI